MFVTAASSNHFKSLKQFLRSLNGAPVIVYDIGLSCTEAEEIKRFPVEYRLFDWSKVPEWGTLKGGNAGFYVWKPVIIHDVFQEGHELTIWCDAGNLVTDISALENCVRAHKIFTGTSSGNLTKYTHDVCLNEMGITPEEKTYTMRNAACIGFVASDEITRRFLDQWKSCCLRRELIEGSRDNHRHDQSILSCLFYKYKRTNCPNDIGYKIQQDCD